MFYLIGLGLGVKSISLEALEKIKKCKKVYLESYTVNFPYKIEELEKVAGKLQEIGREEVEKEKFLEQAREEDIALLVYGSPLMATTHISLILKCKKEKINFKVIQNAGIMNAVAETGLQLYKLGKTASMPKFSEKYKPDSFFDIILDNKKIKAHTLLLTDISLTLKESLEQLEEVYEKRKNKIEKIVVCENLGTEKSNIYYDSIENLKKKRIAMPFCIIIPSELHFIEKEALESVKL